MVDNFDTPDFIFKKQPNDYLINLSPTQEYIKQATEYTSIEFNIPKEEAKKYVLNTIKELRDKGDINNPIVEYSYRDENGNTSIEELKLTDYISTVVNNNEILAPSFTSYLHPSKNKSLHADFLSINIALRKQDKNNAFKYKQLGDKIKELNYNTLQKVRKVLNNSLSGAYASKSTILYNPSAHYTLTSITRSVASIGNAITESIVAGNKHFRSPDTIMNYINSILSNTNFNTIELVINKHNLYLPTSEEVLDTLLYSSDNYWRDAEFNNYLLSFLNKLTGYQKAAICYTNDLFHIKKFNNEFVKELLTKMSKKVLTGSIDNLKDLNTAPEGINILTHHILADELAGMKVDYKELLTTNPDLLMTIASTTKNIVTTIFEYRSFFRIFFITETSPIGIAFIKDMLRDAIVLSDTDSTCGSYDKWVEWYFGAQRFSSDAIGLSAAVMTINSQVMDHYIKVFAKNMNVDYSSVELLKMKNEYYWPIFTATNVSKHYFADTLIQEGNVFKEPDLELKGVHLIASNADQSIVKAGHNIIKDINKRVVNNEKLKLLDYVTQAADLERLLLEKIKKGDISIFKNDKIKDKLSYKNSSMLDKTPYIHHLLWEEVFSEKYGNSGEPTYMVIKVPTMIESSKDLEDYLNRIDDKEIANKLRNFLNKYNKKALGTFRPPINVISNTGLPEEILLSIDTKRIIMDNMNMIYMVLESIGFYKPNDKLITDLGY